MLILWSLNESPSGERPRISSGVGKVVDAQMRHGDAVADIAVALVFLVRFMDRESVPLGRGSKSGHTDPRWL